jgi:hypothetical protein
MPTEDFDARDGLLETSDPEQLRKFVELEESLIAKRRQNSEIAKLGDDAPPVGLALSGGGIRSAMFGFGFVQALADRGFLRLVDYLSTISGGGYIGGSLTAAANRLAAANAAATRLEQPPQPLPPKSFHDWKKYPPAPLKDNKYLLGDNPFALGENGKQNQSARRFQYGGLYLLQWRGFVPSYLVGLVSMILIVLAPLVLCCTVVALLFRSLDSNRFRDHLMLLDWNHDVFVAFYPAIVFGFLGLAFYALGAIRRRLEKKEKARKQAPETESDSRDLESNARFPAGWALILLLAAAAFFQVATGDLAAAGLTADDVNRLRIGLVVALAAISIIVVWEALRVSSPPRSDALAATSATKTFETRGRKINASQVGATAFIAALAAVWCAGLAFGWERELGTAGAALTAVLLGLFLAVGRLRTAARSMLWLALVCVPIGVAVLLGNGLAGLPVWIVPETITFQKSLQGPFTVLVVLLAAPLVFGRMFLRSGQEESGTWRRLFFNVVAYGLAVMVPLFLVYLIAAEDRSHYIANRGPNLIRNDLLDVPAIAEALSKLPSVAKEGCDKDLETAAERIRELERVRLLIQAEPFPSRFAGAVGSLLGFDTRVSQLLQQSRAIDLDLETKILPLLNVKCLGSEDLAADLIRLAHSRPIDGMPNSDGGDLSGADRWIHHLAAASKRAKRLKDIWSGWTAALSVEMLDYLKGDAPKCEASLSGSVLDVPEKYATSRLWPRHAARLKLTPIPSAKGGRRLYGVCAVPAAIKRSPPAYDDQADPLDGAYERMVGFAPRIYLKPEERSTTRLKEFNRLMLEAEFPNAVRPLDEISTPTIIDRDQRMRLLGWLPASLALTLLVWLCIDVNDVSLHRFYRDRLNDMFLRVGSPTADSAWGKHGPEELLALKDVRSVEVGAPLHLIGAAQRLYGTSATTNRRDIYHFLFSQSYCGSDHSGMLRTDRYPLKEVTLADAVAISGAAVSPVVSRNPVVTALMLLMNFRLGRWVVDGRTRWRKIQKRLKQKGEGFVESDFPERRVTPWRIFRNYFRRDKHERLDGARSWDCCFVADGGFDEFLGLEQLLLRRSRLAVVVDAGCYDGPSEFGTIGTVIRRLRVHHGILITDAADPDRPLDLRPLERDKNGFAKQAFVVGRIVYPKGGGRFTATEGLGADEGVIVYAQMKITSDVENDLHSFRVQDKTFPNDPTTNQFYTQDQIESYRQLGCHVGDDVAEKLASVIGARQASAAELAKLLR